MTGQKAVVIIIIAMMLTAGVGFLLNFDKQTVTKTEYTPIGNMDALISANSGRTQESELYNSVYNVTGWQPNTGVVRLPSGQANTYILKEAGYEDIATSYSLNFAERGITTSTYTEYNPQGDGGRIYTSSPPNPLYTFLTSAPSVVYNPVDSSAPVLSNGKTIIGGYGQKEYEGFISTPHPSLGNNRYLTSYLQYSFNGNIVSYSETNPGYVVFVSLSDFINMNDVINDDNRNDTFRLVFNTEGLSYYAGVSINTDCPDIPSGGGWSASGGKLQRTDTITVNITTTQEKTVSYLRYNVSTQNWTVFHNGQNEGNIDPTQFYIVCTNSSIPGISANLIRTTYVPPTYADPTKYVNLSALSEWSNHYVVQSEEVRETTFINTGVDILIKGSGTFRICDESNNWTVPLAVTYTDGKYSINGTNIGTYIGVRISMSSLTNTLYAEGIVSDESGAGTSDTPTYNYSLSGFRFNISLPSGFIIPNMYRIQFTPAESTTMQVYIENTYILSDPNQVLWNNIDINLGDYFPDNINKLRLLLQGFVRYGDRIYINGDSTGYLVTDGKFTITQGDTSTTFVLNGTAIDFFNGHVYVVQSNGKARVDLGEILTYDIRMTGVWYFSTTASDISVYEGEVHVWTPKWTMDLNTTILTFVGVIFASLVIMGMRYRDELELMDVIVLILTMLIASSLLVVS